MPIKTKPKRLCDDCHACCTSLRIDSKIGYSTRFDNGEDIAKKAGETCRFLKENGCSIYEHRPVVCRRFICDWLGFRNNLQDSEKPIKSGFIGIRGRKIYF